MFAFPLEVMQMSERIEKPKSLPTLWRVPDELWGLYADLIQTEDPPKKMGRPRIDPRRTLDGIIFHLRTGCQWNQLPAEFGNDASVHRTFQRWESLGLFDKLWAQLVSACEELAGIDWEWQSADACLSKARGVPKKGRKTKPVARTLQIVVVRVSRKACLSKETADRLPSRLAGPTFQTRICSR